MERSRLEVMFVRAENCWYVEVYRTMPLSRGSVDGKQLVCKAELKSRDAIADLLTLLAI